MSTRPPVRPSGWWFAVAVLAAVVGLAAGVAVIVRGATGYADKVENFDRAGMPTTLEVEITETGGYSIYHEYPGASADDLISDPDVEVTDPSGREVTLRPYDTTVTYDVSGYEGVGVLTFDADEPGTYEVEASMEFSSRPSDVIAVGPGLGRDLVLAIAAGVALIGLGIVSGIVIAIVVGVLRGRSRRAAMPAPVPGWGPPGAWGAPAWPAPPGSPPPGPSWPSWPPASGPSWPPAPTPPSPPAPPAAPPQGAPPRAEPPQGAPPQGAPPHDAPSEAAPPDGASSSGPSPRGTT